VKLRNFNTINHADMSYSRQNTISHTSSIRIENNKKVCGPEEILFQITMLNVDDLICILKYKIQKNKNGYELLVL